MNIAKYCSFWHIWNLRLQIYQCATFHWQTLNMAVFITVSIRYEYDHSTCLHYKCKMCSDLHYKCKCVHVCITSVNGVLVYMISVNYTFVYIESVKPDQWCFLEIQNGRTSRSCSFRFWPESQILYMESLEFITYKVNGVKTFHWCITTWVVHGPWIYFVRNVYLVISVDYLGTSWDVSCETT